MDRTNVETVIVAGKVRKWKGQLLDVDLPHLPRVITSSLRLASRRICSAANDRAAAHPASGVLSPTSSC